MQSFFLTVTFVKGGAGMSVCFLLFYAVNPVYAVTAKVFAGKNIRQIWSIPVFAAVLFLAGTWIFYSAGYSFLQDILFCKRNFFLISFVYLYFLRYKISWIKNHSMQGTAGGVSIVIS